MSEDQNTPENPEEKSFSEQVNETTNEVKEGFQEVVNSDDNKRLLVGILAIIFGSLGIHKFILGYNKEGVILLAATIIGYATSCFVIGMFVIAATVIVGLVEGIIYLTKTDEEFRQTYQVGTKPWF